MTGTETPRPESLKPPVDSAKLTRRYLMSLAEGLYVVSNCYERVSPGAVRPILMEPVASQEERAAQWERVKAVYAHGRSCDVFESQAHFKDWRRCVEGAPRLAL